MRRGWLRRNRLTTTLPYTIRCAGGFGLLQVTNQAYFFGEVLRAEALGLKREDRPADFAGRSESVSCIFCWWDTAPAYIGEYPIPLACSLNTAARSHRKELRKCGRGKSGHLREKQCDPLQLASGLGCRGRRHSRVHGGPVLGAWSKSTLGNLSTASRKVGQAHKPSLCTAALAFSSVVCEIRMAERPQASPLQSHELQLTW